MQLGTGPPKSQGMARDTLSSLVKNAGREPLVSIVLNEHPSLEFVCGGGNLNSGLDIGPF